MTEQEWLECAEPWTMVYFAWEQSSDRKRRLFAVACCRRIWQLLTDARSRQAVETAELAADDLVSYQVLTDACAAAVPPMCSGDYAASAAHSLDWRDVGITATLAASAAAANSDGSESEDRLRAEQTAQCGLLRELMGNPFRPAVIHASWLTAIVIDIAQAIYDERAFDRLPILADALEDAGCDSADILNHCRQPGEHVRGCWCVDLVLDRE